MGNYLQVRFKLVTPLSIQMVLNDSNHIHHWMRHYHANGLSFNGATKDKGSLLNNSFQEGE